MESIDTFSLDQFHYDHFAQIVLKGDLVFGQGANVEHQNVTQVTGVGNCGENAREHVVLVD